MVLQSAFNYLSQASSQLVGLQSIDQRNHLIGQNIEVGNELYVIRSLIAEGGFALVVLKLILQIFLLYQFAVQNKNNAEWFALKRVLAHDKATAELILREIRFMKQVIL
jgi:hypothetical protein